MSTWPSGGTTSPEIRRLLEQSGWRYEPVDDEAIVAGFRSGTVLLELTFAVSDAAGGSSSRFPSSPGCGRRIRFGERAARSSAG